MIVKLLASANLILMIVALAIYVLGIHDEAALGLGVLHGFLGLYILQKP